VKGIGLGFESSGEGSVRRWDERSASELGSEVDWLCRSDGFIGTHPVYYSAWYGHSLYPHSGCFKYAGEKVDLGMVLEKFINISNTTKKIIKVLPVFDAHLFDYADKGPAWFSWRQMQFLSVNGSRNPQHAWWFLKNDWTWGNAKMGHLHFTQLTPSGTINNDILPPLAEDACNKADNSSTVIEMVCGLTNAPRAPSRHVSGIFRHFGSPKRCQPLLQWVNMTDLSPPKYKVKQCIDGPELTHGRKDPHHI
jgi:hypothetical protein